MAITHSRLGWRPDLPDHRDFKFGDLRIIADAPLPARLDMTSLCPPIYDQMTLGSCTANATGGLAHFLMKKFNLRAYVPSRLFIYWNSRALIGETELDDGATLRDSMKVVTAQGLPPESIWWYNPAKFAVKPSQKVYQSALNERIAAYYRLESTDVEQLRKCLFQGYPFVFGFSVYPSMLTDEVARYGRVPMPSNNEAPVGGHAVMAVGYNHDERYFIVRNSWGKEWGVDGYFTMPYDYLTNLDLADDFWTARAFVTTGK
jgi:C1A family cysteine protease